MMSNNHEFTFPLDIWDKIIQKLDRDSWKNLSSTCKFFNSYKIIHVQNFKIIANDGCSDVIKPIMKDLKIRSDEAVKKLFISQKFHSSTRRPLSPILSKIIKCNLAELRIEYNNLTWNEYVLLTSGGKIKILSLEGVNIKHPVLGNVSLHSIMSGVPEAYDVYIQPCYFKRNTFKVLKSLPRRCKIRNLTLAEIDRRIDPREFFDYCKDVLQLRCVLYITFRLKSWNMSMHQFYDVFEKEMKKTAKEFRWYCKLEKNQS